MTRKSAASAKPKAQEPSREEQLEKLHRSFDENKQAFIQTVKTQIVIADRFDNYLNVEDLAMRIMKVDEIEIELGNELTDESIRCYELVLEQVEKFEFDEFVGEEPPDYFSVIMPDRHKLVDKLDKVYSTIRYMSVKPYADKMLQMWQTLRQQKMELGL